MSETIIDKLDRKLLRLMQKDSAISVAQLAENIGVSKSACWRRIHKLEQAKVIHGRVTLLNQHTLNLGLTVYISVRTSKHNDQWAQQFRNTLVDLPEVIEIHRMSGDLDYLIKAVTSDMAGYDRLYKKIIKADLLDVSASFVMETLKHTTELPV